MRGQASGHGIIQHEGGLLGCGGDGSIHGVGDEGWMYCQHCLIDVQYIPMHPKTGRQPQFSATVPVI